MGFTIDMVSGDVFSDASSKTSKKSNFNEYPTEVSGHAITEQLVSICESDFDQLTEKTMPESVSQLDIDSFLDKFN